MEIPKWTRRLEGFPDLGEGGFGLASDIATHPARFAGLLASFAA